VTKTTADPPKRLSDIDGMALYTVHELAPLLKATPRTVRKYCAEKVFANARNSRGKHWLIPGCDVLDLYPNIKASG